MLSVKVIQGHNGGEHQCGCCSKFWQLRERSGHPREAGLVSRPLPDSAPCSLGRLAAGRTSAVGTHLRWQRDNCILLQKEKKVLKLGI